MSTFGRDPQFLKLGERIEKGCKTSNRASRVCFQPKLMFCGPFLMRCFSPVVALLVAIVGFLLLLCGAGVRFILACLRSMLRFE